MLTIDSADLIFILMKFKLICIGKTGKRFLVDGENEYIQRLKHYCKLEKIELPDIKNAKKLTNDEVKNAEGKMLLEKVEQGEQIILLDENGSTFSSVEFSKFIQKRMNQGGKGITFIIGGAYGFSQEVYDRAQFKISLSKMTFSHQMIRVIFLEQLYRAHTILRGEPYHHQ